MSTTKPDVTPIWGSDGSALIATPADTKIELGWEVEKPPVEYENWFKNMVSKYINHLNERGIPQHDLDTDYLTGALVFGSDGLKYESQTTPNINNEPTTDDGTYWVSLSLTSNVYANTGTANAVVLDKLSGDNPSSYYDGMAVTFKVSEPNTGAVTLQITGLGFINLTITGATEEILDGGELVPGRYYTAVYRSTTDAGVAKIPVSFELAMGASRTWEDLTLSRAVGTTYTNSTPEDIECAISIRSDEITAFSMVINGVDVPFGAAPIAGIKGVGTVSVPPGATYVLSVTLGVPELVSWVEFRA